LYLYYIEVYLNFNPNYNLWLKKKIIFYFN